MAFKDFITTFGRLFQSLTPISGSKRKREDADSDEQGVHRKQATVAGQPSGNVAGTLQSSQAPEPSAFTLAPSYGRAPPGAASAFPSFGMAGRVRELAPRQGDKHAVPNGTNHIAVDRHQQKPQPARQSDNQNAAQSSRAQPRGAGQTLAAPPDTLAATGPGTTAAPSPQSSQSLQQIQHYQQQPLISGPLLFGATRAPRGPQPPASVQHAGLHTTPSASGLPAFTGYAAATPRQLSFPTPDSTLRRFDSLNLRGGTTPHALPAAAATAAAPLPAGSALAPLRFGAAVVSRDGRVFGTSDSRTVAAMSAAAAATAGDVGVFGLTALPPQPGAVYVAPGLYAQPPHLRQQHQLLPPQPPPLQQQAQLSQQHRVPFPACFRGHANQMHKFGLNQAANMTDAELKEYVRAYEASSRFRAPAPTPLREDGGYVGGDDDEEKEEVARRVKGQEARAHVAHVRSVLASAVRKAGSNNARVAAAAVNSQATRRALEASQATAGTDTLAALGAKMSAHQQQISRLRAESEAATQRQLEAVKAEEEALRRAQLKQQQRTRQELTRGLQLPGPAPAGAAAVGPSISATAPPPSRVPAAAAAAPPPKPAVPKRHAAADDGVLDLVSSDEEEAEVEEGPGQGEGGLQDEQEVDLDAADPYGVEYGMYPGEERGRGGNSALRLANRPERSLWRRVMDGGAAPGEILLEYRPNIVTEIELSREKLQCMELGTWLNDEVINLYMLLLQARDTRYRRAVTSAAAAARQSGGKAAVAAAAARAPPRCHFFNSFFYNKLFQDDGAYKYANVRRWTTPKQLSNKLQDSPSILDVDRILMPIHKGVHWTCAEVDLRTKAVRYYDSLGGEDRALAAHLLSWVADESADKLKDRWDTSKWSVEFPKDIPRQTNGCDCGVFSLMFADRLGAGQPLSFSQADMPLLRVQVLARLVNMHVD